MPFILLFHSCPGAHVYVMCLYIIDYGTGGTLNKPTDVFGQVVCPTGHVFCSFLFFPLLRACSDRNGKRFIARNRFDFLKRQLFLFSFASLENWLQSGNSCPMSHRQSTLHIQSSDGILTQQTPLSLGGAREAVLKDVLGDAFS